MNRCIPVLLVSVILAVPCHAQDTWYSPTSSSGMCYIRDVDCSSISDNDFLQYNGSTLLWETVGSGSGGASLECLTSPLTSFDLCLSDDGTDMTLTGSNGALKNVSATGWHHWGDGSNLNVSAMTNYDLLGAGLGTSGVASGNMSTGGANYLLTVDTDSDGIPDEPFSVMFSSTASGGISGLWMSPAFSEMLDLPMFFAGDIGGVSDDSTSYFGVGYKGNVLSSVRGTNLDSVIQGLKFVVRRSLDSGDSSDATEGIHGQVVIDGSNDLSGTVFGGTFLTGVEGSVNSSDNIVALWAPTSWYSTGNSMASIYSVWNDFYVNAIAGDVNRYIGMLMATPNIDVSYTGTINQVIGLEINDMTHASITDAKGIYSRTDMLATDNIKWIFGTDEDGSIYSGAADTLDLDATTTINFRIGGSVKAYIDASKQYVEKTATYTATASDYIILCTASSGDYDIDLPAAASSDDLVLVIKNEASSANNVLIDPNGTENIENDPASITLTPGKSRSIICNGSEWHVTGGVF